MKSSLTILMVLVLFLTSCYAVERKGEMMFNLEKDTQFGNWKGLWSDGYELHLISFPENVAVKKIYEIKDKKGSDLAIGNWELSSDNTKVAFAADILVGNNQSNTLYIFNIQTEDLKKIGYCPSPVAIINLRGFLGNNRLLLEGYGKIEDDLLLYYDKAPDNFGYFYIYDLNTHHLEVLNDLGPTTVGMANAKCAGDLLAYENGDGFVIYNVITKTSRKISNGDRPIISPDGQWILFRRGGMTGDYHIINVDGSNEDLVLSEKKIYALLQGSGSYRDLKFASWSPDSKFILLHESSDLQKNRKFVLNLGSKQILEIK